MKVMQMYSPICERKYHTMMGHQHNVLYMQDTFSSEKWFITVCSCMRIYQHLAAPSHTFPQLTSHMPVLPYSPYIFSHPTFKDSC